MHFLPPIAGFVGSDALAVAAATRLAARRVPSMAIDIGTNTEISLSVERQGHDDELRQRPRLRGLPDNPRHEGGRGRHRAGRLLARRPRDDHRHDRRRSARRHLRLGRGRRPGGSGALRRRRRHGAHAAASRRARGPSGARVRRGRRARGATSCSRSTTSARSSLPRGPSRPAGPC